MKYISLIILLSFITSPCGAAQPQHKWELVLDVYPTKFTGIDNYDSLNIMAIANHFGAHKRIYKSTDGGISWDSVFIESDTILKPHRAKDVSYPTKDFCIVACDSGYILKTTDSGLTWEESRIDFEDPYSTNLIEISMLDENHGVTTKHFEFAITHDGGETWKAYRLPPDTTLVLTIQMITKDLIYCFGLEYYKQDTRFFKIRNDGEIWEEYPYPDPFPEFIHTEKMKFIDSLFGYTCARVRTGTGDRRYDRVFRTTDGGETWENRLNTTNDPPFGLEYLDVLDKDNAIFVGQVGKIYWTFNGGETFLYDYNYEIVKEQPLQFYTAILGKQTALTADYRGRIFRSSLVTGVEEEEYEYEKNLYISPNPATDYIEISLYGVMLSEANEPVVKIYDVLGIEHPATAWHPSAEGNGVRIDISALAPGVYFVKVGGKVSKFVKI